MKKSTTEKSLKKIIKQANKILKEEGMCYKEGKLRRSIDGREKVLANFLPVPIRRIYCSNDDAVKNSIEMLMIVEDKAMEPKIIETQEIEKPMYLNKHYGGICNIYPDGGGYKQVLFAIKLLLNHTDMIEEFNKLGQQKDQIANSVHVFGNEVIGAKEECLISNEIQKYQIDRCDIDEKTAYKQFLKLFKVAKPHVAYPMVCHLFVGLMFKLFQESGNQIDFAQFIVGPTGSMKTTLSFLIQDIFSKKNPDMNLHASCFDTVNDLEIFTHTMCSCVGIIDDLYPSVDPHEARSLENKVQRIIRNIGDGHGKGRLKSDLTRQEKYEPQCAVTFTGEYGLVGQSSLSRLYTVEMTKQDVNLDLLTMLQREESILSTCVYNFIDWMVPQYDKFVDEIRNNFESRRGCIIEKLADHRFHLRKPKMAAAYLIALNYFLLYGIEIGEISEKKYSKMMKKAEKEFLNGIIKQSDDFEENDPVYMFLKTLENLRISNRIKVGEIGQQINDKRLVAFEDSTYIYLLPNAAYNAVFSFWQSRRQNFPLKERALSKAFYTRGLLEVDNSGETPSMHKKKKLNADFRSRVLYVKKDVMDEILGKAKSKKGKGNKNNHKPKSVMKWVK